MPVDLTTKLGAKLTLPTPLLAASGTFGWGEALADLADASLLGALITPTLTLHARAGSPMPRTAEASAGLLHATGLPNPGLTNFLDENLPLLRSLGCSSIVSILGETEAEWTSLAKELTVDGIAALELNLTPPELQSAEKSASPLPEETVLKQRMIETISAIKLATPLPLIAKLPSAGIEIGVAAKSAEFAGADIVSVGQSFPAIAVRLSNRAFRFPGVVAGLSGPAIKPMALYQTWRVAQTTSLPIIGGGGAMTAEDALEYLFTGASAVSIGTANLIHPGRIASITSGLQIYFDKNGRF